MWTPSFNVLHICITRDNYHEPVTVFFCFTQKIPMTLVKQIKCTKCENSFL